MTLEQRYTQLCATPSSINEYLPLLREYASTCDSVAEFGVDIGQSTTAFLMAQPARLVSVDVVITPELIALRDNTAETWDDLRTRSLEGGDKGFCARVGKTHWDFIHQSSLVYTLTPTDFLLIDSSHHYVHTKGELTRHAPKIRKWIALHDTVAYGERGEGGNIGILPAIREFLAANPQWTIGSDLKYNNGMMILTRIAPEEE